MGSRVLELSDRFLDVRSEGETKMSKPFFPVIFICFYILTTGMWFVKFYAPYCGYCKKMEPVWNHVAQALYNTKLVRENSCLSFLFLMFYCLLSIRVGKVDCTRFKSVCQAFKIQGYPTIIL